MQAGELVDRDMASADFLVIALEDTDPYAAIDLDLAKRIRKATADAKYADVLLTQATRRAAKVLTEAYTRVRSRCLAGLLRWKSERIDLVGA